MPRDVSPVFTLPAFTIGPYCMRPVAAVRADFDDKRRKVEHDWTGGRILIDRTWSTRKTLEGMMRAIVTTIHYRSGLNDTCDEEAYTHSLATGLTELALNCPEFWQRFNELLENEYCPGAGWRLAALGYCADGTPPPPKNIRFDGRECRFEWKTLDYFAKEQAFGLYFVRKGVVELPFMLRGANASVVALHETLHFLHECAGLKDRHDYESFRTTQTHTLLRFWQQNPQWWVWWLHRTRPSNHALPLAA